MSTFTLNPHEGFYWNLRRSPLDNLFNPVVGGGIYPDPLPFLRFPLDGARDYVVDDRFLQSFFWGKPVYGLGALFSLYEDPKRIPVPLQGFCIFAWEILRDFISDSVSYIPYLVPPSSDGSRRVALGFCPVLQFFPRYFDPRTVRFLELST